jgi:AcrR family transcriptional regulator
LESDRRDQLLELAYQYVLEHGMSTLSLRPLAAAIGSSPRVLLFLFGSKDGLVRALLARARSDEVRLISGLEQSDGGLRAVAAAVWEWLAADEHQAVLRLWAEAYARSLVEPEGPWADFARATVDDWLGLLAAAQPADRRDTAEGVTERTLVLAVLRGALLDLLATEDRERTGAAVNRHLAAVGS